MGKLNFSKFGLQGVEPLSRDDMKKVSGGAMAVNCTYYYNDGSSESGPMAEEVPGFDSPEEFAQAFCAGEERCDRVECS